MSMNVNQESAGRVLRIEITERLPTLFGGESFGHVGEYERLTGWAQLDLDPLHPLNAGISNLEFALREADGRVHYKVDVCIMRPMDLDRGNGWLLYEVVNRGTKRALQRINGARPNNFPSEPGDIGTGFLLRNGFTIAWSGWQGDLVREPGRMLADLPVARRPDGPITARVREEFILEARNTVREDINEPIVEVSEEVFIAPLHYPTADLDPAGKTLTVRARQIDPRVTPPGLTWRFVDDRHIEIHKAPGFDRSALYEFIYEAKDPIVLGAGLAGIRDINAFLRYETADAACNPNPLLRRDGTPLPHAMAFGLSQSGRVLRECLYNGWNRDAQGRRIFDGVITFVTGSRRGVIAQPFVHVTRYSRQHEDHLYPGDQFPFTFSRIHDPISGKTEGILDKVVADGVAPKIIHVDTDSEIWSGRSSLVVTDCEGNDLPPPDNVRVYLCNGLPHGPFRLPEVIAALPANLLSYHFIARAAVAAMRAWIEDGVEPPPSRFPSRAAGTLVSYEEAKAMFPKIPGIQFPKAFNELRIRDYSSEPPIEGAAYPVFVTACDADGNGIGGVRHPLVAEPVGTHVGWQIRRDGYAGGDLFNLFGAFIPFAETKAERLLAGDPRLSLEERYSSLDNWAERLAAACTRLVEDRLLLEEDVPALIDAARKSWSVFDAI
jgi:Alpha/beta hydrolase domain